MENNVFLHGNPLPLYSVVLSGISVTIMVRKRKEGLQSSAFFVFLACMEKKSTAHDCHPLDDHACCCFYYVKTKEEKIPRLFPVTPSYKKKDTTFEKKSIVKGYNQALRAYMILRSQYIVDLFNSLENALFSKIYFLSTE